MASSVDKIRDIIERYLEELEKHGIRISSVILFGSYAKGLPDVDSDIDLAIISPDFTGNRFLDRRRIVPLRRKIDDRIEPMPFLPEDFVDGDPLVLEIKASGIEIAPRR